MEDALRQWKRHRVDYRGPGLLALLLVGLALQWLPGGWWRWTLLGQPATPHAPERFRRAERDEGLQLLEAEALPPAGEADPDPVQVAPDRRPPSLEEEAGGEGRQAFDPTRAYRLRDEILRPSPRDSLRRSLDYLVSMEGIASLTPEDTGQAARARSDFARRQQLSFQGMAPVWAHQKAVERYREMMDRMLLDDPLRGPQ